MEEATARDEWMWDGIGTQRDMRGEEEEEEDLTTHHACLPRQERHGGHGGQWELPPSLDTRACWTNNSSSSPRRISSQTSNTVQTTT